MSKDGQARPKLDALLTYAPLLISAAALLFSTFSWYRADVQVRTGLLAVPVDLTSGSFGDPSGHERFVKKVENDIIFINTGNRPVVVLRMSLSLVFRPPDDKRTTKDVCRPEYRKEMPENTGINTYGVTTAQLPLVLQPGGVTFVKAEHDVGFAWDEAFNNGTILICLNLTVIDNEGRQQDKIFPYGTWWIYPEDSDHGSGGGLEAKRLWVLGEGRSDP